MAQYGWIVALDKCVGCRACSTACKAEMNTAPRNSPMELKGDVLPVSVDYRAVVDVESGTYPAVTKTFVTMACNHCANPACLTSCPVGAISKRDADGIVLIDQEKCIGCNYCLWVCPYGAPQFNSDTRKVEKCTFCVHRIDAGLTPACVTTCPGRALSFTTDFSSSSSGENAPEGFARASLTTPSVRFET